ncbi:MAG: DUF4114 domain-containing protein [Geminicoccaceae bacterium]|nr:MAG: DUF4114 domain-containing protein [Geminicoccaceae bacterium]
MSQAKPDLAPNGVDDLTIVPSPPVYASTRPAEYDAPDLGTAKDAKLETIQILRPEDPEPERPPMRPEEGQAEAPSVAAMALEGEGVLAAATTVTQPGHVATHTATADVDAAANQTDAAPPIAVDPLLAAGPDIAAAHWPTAATAVDAAVKPALQLVETSPVVPAAALPGTAEPLEPVAAEAADPGTPPVVVPDLMPAAPLPSIPTIFELQLVETSPVVPAAALPGTAEPLEPVAAEAADPGTPPVVVPDLMPAAPLPSIPTVFELRGFAATLPSFAPVAVVPPPDPTPPVELAPIRFAATPVAFSFELGTPASLATAPVWERPEMPTLPEVEVFATCDVAPLVDLPAAPSDAMPPQDLPTFAAPLPLPEPPTFEPFRPSLRVSGGSIVYDARGEVISAPSDTKAWTLLDPFGGDQRGLTPEYLEGTSRIHDLTLEHDHPVSVTFIGEGAGHRNTLGYYRIGPDGEISDVRIIWKNASGAKRSDVLEAWQDAAATPDQLADIASIYGGINEGGDLVGGLTTVALDNLKAGDSFGFFLVSNGYNNGAFRTAMAAEGVELSFRTPTGESAHITPGLEHSPRLEWRYVDAGGDLRTGRIDRNVFHTAAHDDTLRLNSSGHQQVIGGRVGDDTGALGIWGVQPGDLLIGFEDIGRPGGDSDFNDVVFRLNIDPAEIERLETVSHMPTAVVGSSDTGLPIVAVKIEAEALAGAALRLAGEHLLPGEGSLVFEDHVIGYTLEFLDGTGDAQRLQLAMPEGLADETASRLLGSLGLTSTDGSDRPLAAGDRIFRYSVATEAADSDVVQAVVRVAHNPESPVVPPPTTVIDQGPSHDEIAARNAEVLRLWEEARDHVIAVNGELATAEAALQTAHAEALVAHAALAAPRAAVAAALAQAEAARAELSDAIETLASDQTALATSHAIALAAQDALRDAATGEAAALAGVEAARGHHAAALGEAQAALAELSALEAEAQVAAATAQTALAALEHAEKTALATATEANALLVDREAAAAAEVAAAETAIVAHTAAEEAHAAVVTLAQELTTLVATLETEHAALVSRHGAVATEVAELANDAAAVEAAEAARQEAHASWAAAPNSAVSQAVFLAAAEAYAAAEETYLARHAAVVELIQELEASVEAFAEASAARAPAEATLAAAIEGQAAAAAEALASAAVSSAHGAAVEAAATAHAEAVGAYEAAAAAATQALSDAAAAVTAADAARTAHDEALEAFGAGPAAAVATAVSALETMIAGHGEALEQFDASFATASTAVDDLGVAEANAAAAVAAVEATQTVFRDALADVDATTTAFGAVEQAYAAALQGLDEQIGAYEQLLVHHGLAQTESEPTAFLDIPFDGPLPDSVDPLVDFALLTDAVDGGGAALDQSEQGAAAASSDVAAASTAGFDPALDESPQQDGAGLEYAV